MKRACSSTCFNGLLDYDYSSPRDYTGSWGRAPRPEVMGVRLYPPFMVKKSRFSRLLCRNSYKIYSKTSPLTLKAHLLTSKSASASSESASRSFVLPTMLPSSSLSIEFLHDLSREYLHGKMVRGVLGKHEVATQRTKRNKSTRRTRGAGSIAAG